MRYTITFNTDVRPNQSIEIDCGKISSLEHLLELEEIIMKKDKEGAKTAAVTNWDEAQRDTCVTCGNITHEYKSTNIDFRTGYIEGAGQLCHKCLKELINK